MNKLKEILNEFLKGNIRTVEDCELAISSTINEWAEVDIVKVKKEYCHLQGCNEQTTDVDNCKCFVNCFMDDPVDIWNVLKSQSLIKIKEKKQ